LEIIALVDREEERSRSELISAALQVLDVGLPEQKATKVQKLDEDPEAIELSDFLLSSLDPGTAPEKNS
jgi:hypothetical protein